MEGKRTTILLNDEALFFLRQNDVVLSREVRAMIAEMMRTNATSFKELCEKIRGERV